MKGSEFYLSRRGYHIPLQSDLWLERWRHLLATAGQGRILELGCGGRDTRYLVEHGCNVLCCDNSDEALALCRERVPLAQCHKLDLSEPLPFPDNSFPLVLASLCLHYFPWDTTVSILEEIRRCLTPGGFLLGRVNSLNGMRPVAGHEEVEPHLYLIEGKLKRFFDRSEIDRLIGSRWRPLGFEEMSVDRYGAPRMVWEFALEKTA